VTSGHWPVVFSISSDDKRLFAGAIVVDMSCASGESFAVPDEFVGNRRFRPNGTIRFVKPIAPFATPGGSLISGSRSIAVRLNRKRMTLSGTWRLHLDFTFVNGQTDHCDSGQVHVSTRL
jgi:hypothetical protein